MDDLHRKNDEQLNISDQADFTVEDIVKEFGSEPQTPEEELKIWTPKAKPASPTEPEEAEDPETEEKAEQDAESMSHTWHLPHLELPKVKTVTYDSPEDAVFDYTVKGRRLRLGSIFSWVLMLLSAAAAVIAANPQWGLTAHMPMPLINAGTLAVLLLHSVLAFPVLRSGLEALLQGRFTAKTLIAFAVLITALRGFLTLDGDALSLSGAASFLLTVSLWGEYLLVSAKLRTVKAVLAMGTPLAATRLDTSRPCLCRTEGDISTLMEDVESAPGAEKTLGAASAILAAACVAVSVIWKVRAEREFLWALSVLLLGVCPLGGTLAYGRAFCLASRRLKAAGAALTGWAGAKKLSGTAAVMITDSDLFPPANLSMNGIKVFGNYTPERLLGYAAAILQQSGAENVARLFETALEAQNGRRFTLDNFRTYEAGGLGGEIQGDVVLLGGLGFIQTMGVHLPEDTRLKQALYISVGGHAEGVFALQYNPSDAVRSGLAALMGSRGLSTVLATRDTLLTPAAVSRKYSLPADRLEYPVSRERAALADVRGKGEQGAFLARGSFFSFATAVCAGRQLRRSVSAAVTVALVGAVTGFVLMSLLTLIGAVNAAGALNLMLYQAIWLIPTALITGLVGK